MYVVVESREAQKAFHKMQPQWAKRIRAKVDAIAQSPYAKHNNASKLQGSEYYRLRVGDWRVIYEIRDRELVVHVVTVKSRGSVYQ